MGTVQLWTPMVMVNSPYLGSATGSSASSFYGSYSFTAGGLTLSTSTGTEVAASLSPSNGEAEGWFELDTWTIYQAVNQPAIWVNNPCTQPYVAKITTTGNQYRTYTLVPSGSENDGNEMTSFSDNGYNSVVFHNGYNEIDGSVSTCGSGSGTLTVSTSVLTEESVSVSLSAGTYTSDGTLAMTVSSGYSTSNVYSYSFPGNGGTWNYDNLNGEGAHALNDAVAWAQFPCSTGGGCVLSGTNVTLANGGVAPVEDLRPGDKVLAWNTRTSELATATVSRVLPSYVGSIEDINHGLLYASGPDDQPIYARLANGTQGWIMLGQLAVGDSLFNPANGSWTLVTSIQVESGAYHWVYDVKTSPINDYIANGVLVDMKY